MAVLGRIAHRERGQPSLRLDAQAAPEAGAAAQMLEVLPAGSGLGGTSRARPRSGAPAPRSSRMSRAPVGRQDPYAVELTVAHVCTSEPDRVGRWADEAAVRGAIDVEVAKRSERALPAGDDRARHEQRHEHAQRRRASLGAARPDRLRRDDEVGPHHPERLEDLGADVFRVGDPHDAGDDLADDEIPDVGVDGALARIGPQLRMLREHGLDERRRVGTGFVRAVDPADRHRVRESGGVAEEVACRHGSCASRRAPSPRRARRPRPPGHPDRVGPVRRAVRRRSP